MSQTHSSVLVHCVFSTKDRMKLIPIPLQTDLWAYMGGIASANRIKPVCIGGIEDHSHILIALPRDMAVAKAVQLIKGGSSKWIHESFPDHRAFAWQEGYGAFSVSPSQLARTIAYINNQKEHHRKRSFEEEFIQLLDKHGIAYDKRYVFR